LGKARSVVLSTRTFQKVGDATAFFKDMLHRYAIGDRISHADAIELTALIQRHEEVTEKIGVGISHFEVRLPPVDSPPFSKKCFWIVRVDGESIDFSYKHCLEARPYD